MHQLAKASLILALATIPAWAQTFRPMCSVKPQFCKQKISPMTAEEKSSIAVAEAKRKAAINAETEAERELKGISDKIIAAHGMKDYPAVNAESWLGVVGGTCLGSINFNSDGYIVYTPAKEIESCETESR